MRAYASKHRIYTIVASKRLIVITLCVGIFISIFLLFSIVNSDNKSIFDSTFDGCSKIFLSLKSKNTISGISSNFIPEPEAFLKSASPVFSAIEFDKSPVSFETNTASTPPQNTPAGALTTEKSIKSVNLEVKNETPYTFSPDSLVKEPSSYDATGEVPKVLIVHTHACETYSDTNGTGLGKGGEYRSTDTAINMIRIGEVFREKLSGYGINVIHDKTLCDYPSYNDSYKNSLEVISRYLKKYPSIEFVFDIHRDALADENNTPVKLIYEKGNKKTAQGMIVCGTDQLGLEHPHWRENLTLAMKIQKYLETNYPGFIRPLNLRKERFNMHLTKGSLLFEIGTHANTLEEAIWGAEIFAEAVGEIIGKSKF